MERRFLLSALLAAAAIVQVHTAAGQSASPNFPRLGGYFYNPTNFDNPSIQANIAKLNIAILGFYPGWSGSGGSSPQAAAAAIKAINPNIKILGYTDPQEIQGSAASGSYASLYNSIAANNWWLRTSGTTGSIVQSNYGAGWNEINITTFTNYPSWRASYDAGWLVSPSPAIDGFFVDTVFWSPRVNGDWSRSGGLTSDSNATVQAWFRSGYASYANSLKGAMGAGKLVFANTADWGNPGAVLTQYQGVFNGGVIESIIGQSWSIESYGGWSEMMAAYHTIMAASAAPQMQIFAQDGSVSDYQSMRYGLASCLMDNGYYYHTDNGATDKVVWYDEFGADLGAATSTPQTSAWQKGVYRRDFQNGIALVNPKGNGTQTVTLETSFRHISGTQAPSVNNGQSVTTVTLNDRDGVILLRTAAQPIPDAPTLTVQ